MGTIVRIDVCQDIDDKIQFYRSLKRAWQEMERIEEIFSVTNNESELSRLNSSQGGMSVSYDLYDLMKKSIQLSRETKGAFDITVKPLLDLWQEGYRRKYLPSSKEIEKVKEVVGFQQVEFSENQTVSFKNTGMKIGMGAIAKGYAIDRVVQMIRAEGIYDFLIDAGGDLFVSGKSCRGDLWRIGVRHPLKKEVTMERLHLTDQAVATSGNYERYFEIQDERYSHIIDPRSGYPVENNLSVTVMAPSALEADALATALSILSPEEGLSLIHRKGKAYGVIIYQKKGMGGMKRLASEHISELYKP